MHQAPHDCVITGLGVVCAVARNQAELIRALDSGRDGITEIQRFSTDGFSVHTGAEVPPTDPIESGLNAWDRCMRFAETAAVEAATQARIPTVNPGRVGVVFGTGLADPDHDVHELAAEVARRIGVRGPVLTVSTACSSSTSALGLARELIALGATAVVAGGADVLTPEVFAGFHALGVLSPGKCAPFSEPFGTTLGEGAGFVVVEPSAQARARGVHPIAALSGYGLSGDGYHETSPDPYGNGVRRAVTAALTDAAVRAEDVGYVNAHGSGTEANDPAEWRGIQKALPNGAAIPVSSSKGTVGHTQGAAGVIETIITVLAMARGQAAPTLQFTKPRRFAPPDPVPGPLPRRARYRHALCLNSAFGGSNAALVLSSPAAARVRSRTHAAVRALGVGVVGPFGVGTRAMVDADRPASGRVPAFDLRRVAPRVDPRGLDPMSGFLTAAAHLALEGAGRPLRRDQADGIGLITGAVRSSRASLAAFRRSIDDRGLRDLSASAFARIVLNASAGACSKALGLRGPLTVTSVGTGSGLVAIILAAEMLASRQDARCLLAGGVDEAEADDSSGEDVTEGAALALLARAPEAPTAEGQVTLAGWGLAGPGRLRAARASARRHASYDGPIDREFRAPALSGARPTAFPSALACAEALCALRTEQIGSAWVTSDEGGTMSAALLLRAG